MTQNEIAEMVDTLWVKHRIADLDVMVKHRFSQAITEALSLKGEEVSYDDIQAIANREVQEVMNQGAKLSSEEQFALNELFIELGKVFYSKLQHSTPSPIEDPYKKAFGISSEPSPNPLLEEVKKMLQAIEVQIETFAEENNGRAVNELLEVKYHLTELIQFSEGGK